MIPPRQVPQHLQEGPVFLLSWKHCEVSLQGTVAERLEREGAQVPTGGGKAAGEPDRQGAVCCGLEGLTLDSPPPGPKSQGGLLAHTQFCGENQV